MRLRSLHLDHFRNYQKLEIAFGGSDLHLFVGSNGSGKTNLLEALALLSQLESCRGVEEDALRQWGAEFYRVRARVVSNLSEEAILEITSQVAPRRAKACFLNDVRVPAAGLVGRFPTVLFLPQDLALFTGPPADRRRFLDLILCQVSEQYYRSLIQYQKTLKQRSALLRRIAEGSADTAELPPWNTALAELGSVITISRRELMSFFELALGAELQSLGESFVETVLVYAASGKGTTLEALTEEFCVLLREAQPKDIAMQSTSIGPHRDEWEVITDGHPLSTSGSRGQQRVAVLALLLLQASFLEVRKGEKPVILLDDIFSELDAKHQQKVLESLTDHQVLMTATQIPTGLRDAAVWDVHEGTVMEGMTKASNSKERSKIPKLKVQS